MQSEIPITLKWLKDHESCHDGLIWFKENNLKEIGHAKLCKLLLDKDQFRYANWLVCKILSPKNRIRYAINAAELVLHLFEKQFPDDDRPRLAIKATKDYLENPDTAAAAYAHAARAAARAAYADADAAAYAAAAAAYAAAADAAARAAYNAAYAADNKKIENKIIKYALELKVP
jgi:hypothetical protein